jgi:predicted DNA-binding transcriptional regulator AlpA
MKFPGHVDIQEFALLSGLSVSTIFTYRSRALCSLPRPTLVIGSKKFWKRKTAERWIARRKKAPTRR